MKLGPLTISPLDLLLVAVPAGLVMKFTGAPDAWIFVVACVAIIPLAGWMGRATEHLSAHYGPGVGGLLNASFGNAAELIIAAMALRHGLIDVVKASLTGSIIGNVLLVLGLALLLGGAKHKDQHFNKTSAGFGSTLMALSAVGLLVPGLYALVSGPAGVPHLASMSLEISIVLFLAYIASLVFSLITHRSVFAEAGGGHHVARPWSKGRAITVLVIATAFVGVMSELLVGSVEHTADAWGMPHVFVGVILVAIIGNAAEHSTAVLMAMKNQMDLAMNIAVGSGIQIALFVAPVLVFMSYGFGTPMDLVFTPMEIIAVACTVVILSLVAHDGRSHWLEGLLLLAVYVIL
ncbi:MAG: calcium/proton exchanger, partial [Phycisphaerales bacterium]|nr:calcium/proton exchanger [Phycisphaerales bacterium]